MTFRTTLLLLILPLFLLFACDSSGSNGDSDPPESVEGTWEGSISLSVEVDTTDENRGSVKGTGEFKRSYRFVIADNNGDLSVSGTLSQEIFIERTGEASEGYGGPLTDNRSVEFTTDGTYGPPTMNIEVPDINGFPNVNDRVRWEFQVSGNQATDTLVAGPPFSDPARNDYVSNALRREAKNTTLVLTRQ